MANLSPILTVLPIQVTSCKGLWEGNTHKYAVHDEGEEHMEDNAAQRRMHYVIGLFNIA